MTVLVAYASARESTREIAEHIASRTSLALGTQVPKPRHRPCSDAQDRPANRGRGSGRLSGWRGVLVCYGRRIRHRWWRNRRHDRRLPTSAVTKTTSRPAHVCYPYSVKGSARLSGRPSHSLAGFDSRRITNCSCVSARPRRGLRADHGFGNARSLCCDVWKPYSPRAARSQFLLSR